MGSDFVWIVGTSRSGKTTSLAEKFCHWLKKNDNQDMESFYLKNQNQKQVQSRVKTANLLQTEPGALILASNDDNRRTLTDQIVTLTGGKYPIRGKTILGFIQDEVMLFWPLLVELLEIKAQFPIRLRPETEQELATKLWSYRLDTETLRRVGITEYRLVRRILDLWQLAAYSGVACEDIARVLQTGLQENHNNLEPEFLTSLLLDWRNWCVKRGLLTYSLITELYYQYLFANSDYQQHLKKRYQIIIADNVDDYPAIAYNLFEFLFNAGTVGLFSYNPQGGVRWGLGADPKFLKGLAKLCQVEISLTPKVARLADKLTTLMIELVNEPMIISTLPKSVKTIQTVSRDQLLRQTANVIINEIKTGKIEPEEIAIIAPGLDAIARYSIIEILTKQNIEVEAFNEQRPLISSPAVRALLTLLTLVYPNLGRLVDRNEVAEMLVVLSQNHADDGGDGEQQEFSQPKIDPVRAGLIADHCFVPHPENPHLLNIKTFDRWDRIGYIATATYNEILLWIENKKNSNDTPVNLLYQAIEHFLCKDNHCVFSTLAPLRGLLETAQHYWEIDTRLKETISNSTSQNNTVGEFIQLLQRGTISSNSYPIRAIGKRKKAVTLATIFQYRANHRHHKWHFWLDIGSPLWAQGGAATLFGATLFLQDRLGKPWTPEDEQEAETARLDCIIADLLGRVSERVYLCHSDLAVNGQEQMGPLLPLIHACDTVEN